MVNKVYSNPSFLQKYHCTITCYQVKISSKFIFFPLFHLLKCRIMHTAITVITEMNEISCTSKQRAACSIKWQSNFIQIHDNLGACLYSKHAQLPLIRNIYNVFADNRTLFFSFGGDYCSNGNVTLSIIWANIAFLFTFSHSFIHYKKKKKNLATHQVTINTVTTQTSSGNFQFNFSTISGKQAIFQTLPAPYSVTPFKHLLNFTHCAYSLMKWKFTEWELH